MMDFEQELKKFDTGLDKAAVEAAVEKASGESLKNNPTLQNKVDQIIKRYGLAVNYCQTDSYDLAYIQVKKVVRLLPNDVNVQLLTAYICLHEGKMEQAAEALAKVKALDPNNATAALYEEEMTVVAEPVEEPVEAEAEQEEGKKKEKPVLAIKKAKKPEAKKQQVKPVTGSDFEEVTSNKKSFIYLGIGFLIGVIAMFILVVPTAKNAVKNQYASEAQGYEDQITAKETEIKSLQDELKTAKSNTKKAREELKKYKGENGKGGVFDLLMTGAQDYIDGKKTDAAEALLQIDTKTLVTDSAKELYDTIKDDTFKQAARTFYAEAKNDMYRKDYSDAIKGFKMAIKADDSQVSYYYYLARTYQDYEKYISAKKTYQKIIDDFPGTSSASDAKRRLEDVQEKIDEQKAEKKNATTEKATEKATEAEN